MRNVAAGTALISPAILKRKRTCWPYTKS